MIKAPGTMLESSAREGEISMRAAGARVLAIEPIPGTFAWLTRNIAVNGLGERVRALNLGLGRREGRLRFTGGLDTGNTCSPRVSWPGMRWWCRCAPWMRCCTVSRRS